MAGYQAIIDVIVNGQSGLDRVIQRTDQLNSLIRDISRNPVDLTLGNAERNIRSLSGQFNQTQRSIDSVQRQIRRADSVLATYGQRAFSARRRLDSLSLGTKAYADATRSLNSAIAGQSAQLTKINGLRERLNQLQERGLRQGRAVGSAEGLRAQIEFANSLADSYLRADVAIRRASGGLVQIPRNLSVGGKSSEIRFFNSLAASVEYTSEAFRKFTIASQAASFSLGEASRRRFSALAEGFSSSPMGRISPGGRSFSDEELSGSRNQVQDLINAFPRVARSTAGLEDYRSQLSELLSVLPIASREFTQVAGAIRQVDDILSRVSLRDASKAFGPVPAVSPRGLATDIFSQGLKERQLYADRKLKVDQNLNRLAERIEDTIGDQGERTRLLVQANQALNALAEDRLEDAARELSIIERQRQAYSRLEKQQVQGKFTPLGGGAEAAARQRFEREQVGAAQKTAATRMGWNTALAKLDDFAKEVAQLADSKKAKNKMTWSLAFGKANEIAEELQVLADRKDNTTKMNWNLAIEALNDIASDLAATSAQKGKVIKANWTVSLGKLEDFLAEGFAGASTGGGKPGRMAVSPISGASRAGIIPGSPADKQRTARARLSWLTFFSQALDIAADQTTAATQDAVKLAQQKTKEIERATAQLWRQFGGPALPPGTYVGRDGSLKRSGNGGRVGGSIGQAFRAGGPGAALASLSSPQRLASQQTSATLLAEKLNNLEIKGVNTTAERKRLQEIVNDLSAKDLQLSDELLNNFDVQLNSIRDYIRLQNQVVANDRAREAAAKKGGAGGAGGASETGFAKTLKTLSESLEESRSYFGNKGPGQAIDQIVRAVKGNGAASLGDQAKSAADIGDNVVDTYASRLRGGASEVAKAMFDLGKAGISAIKKALRMASPSRVMLEIARNQIDTYVDFLRASIPSVEAAAKAVGEAGAPKGPGIPESMITKPITERQRTRLLAAEDFERNNIIAEFAASQITGPGLRLDAVVEKVADFINRTRASVDLDKLFADFDEDARFKMAEEGISSGPDFDKLRAALADFYEIPAELTPDLDRGVKAAGDASANADQLQRYISELVSGLGQIGGLLETAARLTAAPARLNDPWGDIAPGSQEASRRYMGQTSFADLASAITDPWENAFEAAAKRAAEVDRISAQEAQKIAETRSAFEPSIQRAAEIDAENARKRISDEFAAARVQAEADAAAAAAAASRTVSNAVTDPIGDAVPDGGRQVRSAIEKLFDRISEVLGFGGGGRPPSPPKPPGGGSGAPGDPEDFVRRVGQATTAEALLGLDELRNVRQLSSRELQLLSAAIEEVQQNLRPATADFDRFNNEITQLRGRIGIEQAARNPDADFFARRRIGPRAGRAISEGLVGGAFPLLFGQGLGASVFGGLGGAAGGFAGGGLGFGLSLVGTALGTAFDTTVAAASELGGALNDLTTTFEVVKNRALFSSRETEKLASKFEEAGFVATASILAQEEVIRKIGTSGVRDLKNLETASDRLSRAWAEFTLQLQVALAGPMAGLLEWVTSIINVANQRTRSEADTRNVYSGLSPADQREFDKEVQRRIAALGIGTASPGSSIVTGVDGSAAFGAGDASIGAGSAFVDAGQIERIRRETVERFRGRSRGATATATQDQLIQSRLQGAETFVNSLNARLSALDLGKSLIDQVKSADQEQEDLDRQRAKAVEDYERAIGDIRLGVERTIQSKRLDNLSRENEIYAKQGDIRLQQLKNENAIARESLRGNDLGQQLFDIVAQYSEEQLATENEIANRRRSLEAELQSVAIETEQYKVDVAKQVADLNRSTAEQVQQIQLSTARKQDQSAKYRFDLEKKIAIAQIQVQRFTAEQEIRKLQTLADVEPDQGNKSVLEKSIKEYRSVIEGAGPGSLKDIEKSLSSLQPPAPLSYAGFNTGQGVSLAGYDAVIAKGNELRLRLEELAKAFDSLVAAGKFTEVNSLLKDLADQGAAEAANQSKDLKYQFDLLAGAADAIDPRLEQLAKGQAKLLQTTAGSKEEFKQLVPLYIQLAEQNIKAADTYQFSNSAIDDNLGQIESLKEEINNLLAGTTEYEKALQSLTQRGLSPASEEAQRLLASAQELDRLKDKIEVINNIRDAATGLTESFRGLIDKFVEFKDAGKAASEFSKEIGQRSFSFILDLAFKPVEENLQKQFIAVADQLGIDVRPEALKQLTELQQINVNTASIKQQIAAITGEGLVKFGASVDGATNVSIGGVSGPIANATNEFGIAEIVRGAVEQGVITEFQAPRVRADLNKYFEKFFPDSYYSGASGAAASQSVALPAPQSSLPSSQQVLPGLVGPGQILTPETIRQYGAMTGQGGPDMPDSVLAQMIGGSGQAFPMDATTANPVPVRVVGPQPINVTPFDGAPAISPEGTKEAEKNLESINEKINETTSGTKAASDKLNTTKGQWLKGLGSVVTGLATASSAVIGIVGGFQQIKQGGLSNTLSGIGSILTTVGSIGLSVAGLSGFTGFGGGGGGNFSPDLVDAPLPNVNPGSFNIAAAGAMFTPNGPIEPFAKGGIVSSPTLFRFAKGGDSGDGLMGEDGAEAILPLGRTPSGDLGVKSIPYERQSGGSRLRVPYLRADAEYAGGGTDSPIRFESTVINSEEFVTRDEAEKIGRAAASRGAEIAQRRIKNNPQVRRSLGMV